LDWSDCTDPESTAVKYAVYLGTPTLPATPTVENLASSDWEPPSGSLTYGASCQWQVVATDADGVASTGGSWGFTVATNPPPAAVTDLVEGTPTANSVPLTWTAPGADGSTGTATRYDVRYSTSTITEANWSSASQASGEPTPHVAGTLESFTVTGLSSNTTYYFALKTRDEVTTNWSELSNAVSATIPEEPPACELTPLQLAFGSVQVGQTKDLTFTIKNTGGGTLTGDVTASCATYSVQSGGGSYSLAANQEKTVTVRFSPASVGSQSCTVSLGGTACGSMGCSGTGTEQPPACELTPLQLAFGSVQVGQTKDLTFTIKNTGGGTLTGDVTASCAAYSLQSGGGSYSLAANQEKTVTVRFAPTSLGSQTCTVSLGGTACGSMGCSGTGTEQPPACQLTPSQLAFGSVLVGQTKDLTFTIKNTGGGTLTGDVTVSCAAYSLPVGVGSYSLAANQEKTVTVRFAPTSLGSQTCTVSLGGTVCGSVGCTGTGGGWPAPEMVLIHAGTFTMGSPASEPGRDRGEFQHQVTLTKAIYVSVREVTQSEWQEVMGWNESYHQGTNRPVEMLTWYDAVSYCNRLSVGRGYTAAYVITGATSDGNHITNATVTWNQTANGYRLLTEAEWEYACRATSTSAFCNGGITSIDCSPRDPNLDQVGWYCGNASTTHDVGGKAANAWGLKDMHGNVWEMCWDWYGAYLGDAADPIGPASGLYRVTRGGGGYEYARYCRSAYRGWGDPGGSGAAVGLRLSRTAQ
jgi:formylglycine-generating enzyme required for sulfatase activity